VQLIRVVFLRYAEVTQHVQRIHIFVKNLPFHAMHILELVFYLPLPAVVGLFFYLALLAVVELFFYLALPVVVGPFFYLALLAVVELFFYLALPVVVGLLFFCSQLNRIGRSCEIVGCCFVASNL
jgi:hypothetical protein